MTYEEAKIDNAILDSGGVNQMTIYCEKIEVTRQKMLTIVKNPSTGEIKDNRVLDLLRTEKRVTITGHINSADVSKLNGVFQTRGAIALNYDGGTDNVNIERFTWTKDSRGNDERPLIITMVEGNSLS